MIRADSGRVNEIGYHFAAKLMPADPRHSPPQPVGIKDIAKALGVSTGTVDRALHAKPGINPMTRARVLRMA